MIGFILSSLVLSAVNFIFPLPFPLPLLLAPFIIWSAGKYSFRFSLEQYGFLFFLSTFLILNYREHWMQGFSCLGLVSVLYFTCLVVIHRIHDQHQKLLRETSELRSKNALSHRIITLYAPHFEFWIKPDGQFAYVSPACKRVVNWSPNDLLDDSARFFDKVSQEDRPRVILELTHENRKNDEAHKFQFMLTNSNGQQSRIEMVYHQAYDEKGEYVGKRGTAEDITEHWNAEKTAMASVEQLTLALESANEGMWDFDIEKGMACFNQSYAKALRIPAKNPAIPIQEFYNRVHPDDIGHMVDVLKSHLLGKTPFYETEYRLRMDNKWLWVLDRGRVIERNKEGKALRLVGVHIDISERKRMEEALQQSEMKFRQVAENMREVFWLRDRSTRKFIYISPAFQDIWGRVPEALYEDSSLFMECVHAEDISRVYSSQKELMESGKEMNLEYRILHSSGKERWVWSRAYPIYNEAGEYYRIAGFLEDITERKKFDLSLQESERRYRDLIEQQGGGVAILDQDEKILYVNPAGEEIFGVQHGTLAGQNLLVFLDEDQRKILSEQKASRHQGVETSYELSITRGTGEPRSLWFTATPRFDASNRFLGNIVIFRDISQRKQKEDRLLYVSQHDTLTGLYNRGVFNEEVKRLNYGDQFPIGVIMVDADGLKDINDRMGHSRGDEMLVRIASVLKKAVRETDIVARLGGDEFGIILPSTDEPSLQNVISRIFEQVIEDNHAPENTLNVSISTGGMVCNEKSGLDAAIKQADMKMYAAKRQKKGNQYLISQ